MKDFFRKNIGLAAFLFAAVMATNVAAQAADKDADPLLVKTDKVEVRKSDYDAAVLLLVPADKRADFGKNSQNVIRLLADLLRNKTLAAQAQAAGLDKTPEGMALLRAATVAFYANLQRDQNDKEATKAFEAKKADFEAQAKEIYIVDKKKYVKPAEVKASHILFTNKKYKDGEGLKRATEVRQQIMAGGDFDKLLKEEVQDENDIKLSELGWFTEDKMVPEFSKAAFALEKEGDISEPVKTVFGWHLIRLEGKNAEGQMTFDEAKPIIMNELTQNFLTEQRKKAAQAIDSDPSATLNKEAIDALLADATEKADHKAVEEQIKKTMEGK